MENANSFGVHFLLRQNKQPKAGKYPVYVKISVNNSVAEMATKTYLSPKDWNAVKGLAKPKDANLIQCNNYLVALRAKMATKFQEMELDEAMLTAQELKRKFLGLDKPERKLTLKWLFEEHTRKMKVTLKPGTLKNYYTTRDYIKKYLAEECGGDILLRHLQYEFIEDFQVFVLNNPAKQHDPCTNNGVMKHLERLKKVVKWAAKNRWIVNNPFQYFSLKQDPTTIEFLSKEQLDNLERFLFHSPKMQLVRDLFVFSCYTGMAYVDLMDAGPDKLKVDAEGRHWLYTRRTKTVVKADIPLLPTAAYLIEKYKNDPRAIHRGKFFPYIANQDINRSLKVLAEVIGFSSGLTFHKARHTFATLLISYGVPVTTVQKIMGHAKLSATMVYVHLLNYKIAEDMEDFWRKLKKKPSAGRKVMSPLIPQKTTQKVA